MRIRTLSIENFRSFATTESIALGDITLLVGRNNEGKSSIIRAMQMLQHGVGSFLDDIRVGQAQAVATAEIESTTWPPNLASQVPADQFPGVRFQARINRNGQNPTVFVTWPTDGSGPAERNVGPFNAQEPDNLFHTYLSLRRVREYSTSVSQHSAREVGADLANLYSKVARLASPAHPQHAKYLDACKSVLGFVVAPFPVQNGQKAGIHAGGDDYISVEQMGAGVASALGLLVDLCVARQRVFLIEEPENDIHPTALKALLDLVVEASEHNQFVVSTHSHIVLRELGATPGATVLHVQIDPSAVPPTSTIQVADTPEQRSVMLESLGYALHDFGLADGWLIFEESSAERIVRDLLIPWFVPRLTSFCTVASDGVDGIERRFRDLHGLFLYLHRQNIYTRRAWTMVDAGPSGDAVVNRLRGKFATWPSDRFGTWSKTDFELFYPELFLDRAHAVLGLPHGRAKQDAKKALLLDLLRWSGDHPAEAKAAFERSAAEVIDFLNRVAADFATLSRE